MGKFSFIKTELEYRKFERYLDQEITTLQTIPQTDQVMNVYIKLINDRDELLQRGIELGI